MAVVHPSLTQERYLDPSGIKGGAPMTNGVCPACATPVSAAASFCPSCGLRVTQSRPPLSYASASHMAPAPSMIPGRMIAGRYRLEVPIASGAMGAVWRGCDERLHGRPCAIKSVLLGGATPEEQVERAQWFARETEVLSALRHPVICDIRDVVSEDGLQYLILELIEGRTLADELALRGAPCLPEHEVLAWATVLCEALTYLHSPTPPVIFRDLKPQNIMLRSDGRVTLIDFGIARSVVASGGTAIGTGGYAPPEQYQGLAEARSDMYALAATLHHLLTGRDPTTQAPFTFPNARALAPAISPHVEAALTKALSLVIDNRFGSVAAFAVALTGAPASQQRSASTRLPQPPARATLPSTERLDVLIADAKRTNVPLPNLLLVDPLMPGVVLRQVAEALAVELGRSFRALTAISVLQAGDFANVLTQAQDGDIVYIDDASALGPAMRDVLRQAMLYHTIDVITGSARQVQIMNVQQCTIIGGIAARDLGTAVAAFFSEQIMVERLPPTGRRASMRWPHIRRPVRLPLGYPCRRPLPSHHHLLRPQRPPRDVQSHWCPSVIVTGS